MSQSLAESKSPESIRHRELYEEGVATRFSLVTDEKLLEKLDSADYITVYRAAIDYDWRGHRT